MFISKVTEEFILSDGCSVQVEFGLCREIYFETKQVQLNAVEVAKTQSRIFKKTEPTLYC